jgi:hypothetical protein
MSTESVIDRVRRPEYTGENRCTPCTIANSAIAVVCSAALGVVLWVAGVTPVVVALATVGLFTASAGAIWLRGYLLPGTPELTKRYLPDPVLARFDKLPEEVEVDADKSDDGVDPEVYLQAAGAVEECATVDDLCLSRGFRGDWNHRTRSAREEDVGPDAVVDALGLSMAGEAAELVEFGEAVVLERDGRQVGKWESRAALVADVAAAAVFADRSDEWEHLDAFERSAVLRGLRIFAESCPLCDGTVDLGEETVESCCRSYDVVAVACSDCDSRLFEQRLAETTAGRKA